MSATGSSPASRATVAPGFVTGMLSGLASRPGGPAAITRLLAEAGVDAAVLTDPACRVGVVRYADLYNRLVRTLDDEGFGMFAGPLRPGSFEFLCRAVIASSSLAEALDRATRFLRIVLPDFDVRIERPRGKAANLTIGLAPLAPLASRPPHDASRVFAFEWMLRLIHALACWLVGRGLALDSVRFPYPPPAHADDYALIYTAHSSFDPTGTALSASFAANLLDLPLRRDEASLAAFLDGAPGKIALLYRRDRETVQQVRDRLRDALPELPSAGEVARRLNLSERTLHRRLADEGTNFRAIRDALRRDIALSRLAKTRHSLATIAAELGYAEASAFYRAVVGWTGVSPSTYRKRLGAN
jgi:AraC-like DNA-binding protein